MLGILWCPRAIWQAFLKGRRDVSLYRPELLQLDLPAIRALSLQTTRPATARATAGDVLAFAGLAMQSIGVMLTPILLLALLATLST